MALRPIITATPPSGSSSSTSTSTRTPCRMSTYSTSSTDSSCGLATPQSTDVFQLQLDFDSLVIPGSSPSYPDHTNDEEDQVEYLDLGEKETWWSTTRTTPSRATTSKRAPESAFAQARLDDSPTLLPVRFVRTQVSSPSPASTSTSSSAGNIPTSSEIDLPLDDSPTLPSSSGPPVPLLSLDKRYVARNKVGKTAAGAVRDGPSGPDSGLGNLPGLMSDGSTGKITSRGNGKGKEKETGETDTSLFDLGSLLDAGANNDDLDDSFLPRRPFTGRRARTHPRPPLPTSFRPTESFASTSALTLTLKPTIPHRTSSRSTPVLAARSSSLKSISSITKDRPSIQLGYHNINIGTNAHRPIPIRAFSHPPPSMQNRTSSLKLKRRLSPTFLDSISETPKDLDLSPNGNWALRKPVSRVGHSSSTPDLRQRSHQHQHQRQQGGRGQYGSGPEMTPRVKLRRSNSQSQSQSQSQSDFSGDVQTFPSSLGLSSNGSESIDGEGKGEGGGRSSTSDIARSFISTPVASIETRRRSQHRNKKKNMLTWSPTIQTLSGTKTRSNSYSAHRTSRLVLPEWSPTTTPTSRSITGTAMDVSLSHVQFCASSTPKSMSTSTANVASPAGPPVPPSTGGTNEVPAISQGILRFDVMGSSLDLGVEHEIEAMKSSSTARDEQLEDLLVLPSISIGQLGAGVKGEPDQGLDLAVLQSDLLAFYESESWAWPSPPFRIQPQTPARSHPLPIPKDQDQEIKHTASASLTPALSTSGTLDSLVSCTPSPLTPCDEEKIRYEHEYDSENEGCWLHGEGGHLTRTPLAHGGRLTKDSWGPRVQRPISLGGGSVRSVEIVL